MEGAIFVLLGLAFIAAVPLALIFAVIAVSKCSSLSSRLDNAEHCNDVLEQRLEKLRKKFALLETTPKIETIPDDLPKREPVEKTVPKPVVVPVSKPKPVPEPIVQEPIVTKSPILPPLVESIVQATIVEPPPSLAPQFVGCEPGGHPAGWVAKQKPTIEPTKQPTIEPDAETAQWSALELLIGRKVMLWVAMVLFVLVAAFFVKYAVDNNWTTDTMKVVGIGLFGSLFLAAGKYFSVVHLRRLSTALTSAGICIVFMAGYVSYGYFELIPINYAAAMMSVIVIGGFLLSWHYLSRLIGVIAVFSGLAVPILVPSEIDLFIPFFSYLVILNIGTVILINLMHRAPIAFVAFFGTQLEFCLWHNQNYEPEKLAAVTVFQACMYVVYLIDTTIASMTPKQRANWDDAARAIISPVFFASTLWFYYNNHEVYKDWLGSFAFAFAGFYAILAVLYTRHLRRFWDKETDALYSNYWKAGPVAAMVLSFAFIAVGIPLQFGDNWIALGWYAVACGLWVAASKFENKPFYVLSIIFHLLGLGRFVLYDLPYDRTGFCSERLDACSLPGLIIGGILILASALAYFYIPKDREQEQKRIYNGAFALEGTIFLWFILSLECWRYFGIHTDFLWKADPNALNFTSHASLTVLWTVLSSVMLITGMITRSQAIRITGLVGFVLVTAKIYLLQLFIRPNFSTVGDEYYIAWNPWFVSIAIPVLAMILFAIWQLRIRPAQNPDEKQAYLTLGMNGLVIFWIMTSFECFEWAKVSTEFVQYFCFGNYQTYTIAFYSLTILWTLFALIVLLIGVSFRSSVLRIFSIVVLAVMSMKIYLLDIAFRPDGFRFTLLNPYFLPIAFAAVSLILIGIWFTRISKQTNAKEKQSHLIVGLNGLILLWIAASVECFRYYHVPEWGPELFIARNSLCIFWSIIASVLLVIGISFKSQILRIFGAGGFAAASVVVYVFQIWDRPEQYELVLWNLYFMPILAAVLAMFFFSIWMTRIRPAEEQEERLGFLILGLNALFMIWYALSVECFGYFGVRLELPFGDFIAHSSLSILWGILALILFVVSLCYQSTPLRFVSYLGLCVIFLKVFFLELFQRPEFGTPVWNPYFMTIFVAVSIIMAIAVWAVRAQPVENKSEKYFLTGLGLAGLALLWGAMSFECFGYFDLQIDWPHHRYTAHASLSIFWTFLSLLLVMTGLRMKSNALTTTGFVLLLITFFKVMPFELTERPNDLFPLFNPFAIPMLFLSATIMFASVMTLNALPMHRKVERHIVRIFGFGGLCLLWLSSSLECHASIAMLEGEAGRQAQMALSILWSLFGGILIAIGFIWRSAILRWMAILLFGMTCTKVIVLDMRGLDQLYRIGAIFALAVVLFLAAWAYQKFKPGK